MPFIVESSYRGVEVSFIRLRFIFVQITHLDRLNLAQMFIGIANFPIVLRVFIDLALLLLSFNDVIWHCQVYSCRDLTKPTQKGPTTSL